MSHEFAQIENLENKVRSICKGFHSLYINSCLKKCLQIYKMQKFFMNF